MANTDRAQGMKPVRTLNGASWNGQATLYFVRSDDTAAYNVGDAVAMVAHGDIATGTSAVTLYGTRAAASTSGSMLGPIVGFGVDAGDLASGVVGGDPNAQGTMYIPATKTQNYYVWVADDPMLVFEMQADTIEETAFNKNCPYYVGAAQTGGVVANSVSYAQGSAANTTQAFPLKIVGAVNRADNDLTSPGTYAKIYVMINQHQLHPNTVGV